MQITLFDNIKEIEGTSFCELCLQPCENNIHEECADDWWDKIVMSVFNKQDEDEKKYSGIL